MKQKARTAGLLLLGMLLSHQGFAASQQFDVTLTSSDFLGEDTVGQFYYDVYNFFVTGPTPVSVTLSSPDFDPWLGISDQEILPQFLWEGGVDVYDALIAIESGTVGENVVIVFDAVPGVLYQIAPATYDYNPTALGAYTLFIETPVIPPGPDSPGFPDGVPFSVTTVVPLPPALYLLGSVLAVLGGFRRTARREQ